MMVLQLESIPLALAAQLPAGNAECGWHEAVLLSAGGGLLARLSLAEATMTDRTMQALYQQALLPIAEIIRVISI